MNHILAGCGAGVSESCSKYATSSWSGGGILLGLAFVAVVIIVLRIVFGRNKT